MYGTWDPRGEVGTLRHRLNRLFDAAQDRSSYGRDELEDTTFAPPIDVLEQEDALVVQAELPGVGREDIELNVENNTLYLRGEKRPDKNVTPESYRRAERTYGRFARTFALPRMYDAQKVQATFREGVLEVRIPKTEASLPRKIQVS
jgi:HSP20 family protein